ncbi:DNA repair and recombination protein RadA [Haladaptatus cibarius]|uniref:DNA repair and recombination protein RadA n=1 Tax=Haladaptatus cibarius TaxID=453847 RepID=UPI000678E328|nr:DNA repair and recombination protein RadA [Haladaptatus cibarius]
MTTVELTDLPNVDSTIETQLTDAGYENPQSIAVASPTELANAVNITTKTAEQIIRTANDATNFGGFESGTEVLGRRKKSGKLTTGIPDLDDLLFGGIETQSLTEIFGNEKSGRSTLAHQLAIRVHLPPKQGGLGGRAVYVDTRGKFDPERIVQMTESLDTRLQKSLAERLDTGADVDSIAEAILEQTLVSSPVDTSEQMATVEKLDEKAQELKKTDSPLRLIVVDSLTYHFRAEYQGRSKLPERQQKLNKHLHELDVIGRANNAGIVFTNAMTSASKSYGGAILGHKSSFRLQLKKTSGEKRRIALVDAPNLALGEVGAYIEEQGFVGE